MFKWLQTTTFPQRNLSVHFCVGSIVCHCFHLKKSTSAFFRHFFGIDASPLIGLRVPHPPSSQGSGGKIASVPGQTTVDPTGAAKHRPGPGLGTFLESSRALGGGRGKSPPTLSLSRDSTLGRRSPLHARSARLLKGQFPPPAVMSCTKGVMLGRGDGSLGGFILGWVHHSSHPNGQWDGTSVLGHCFLFC